MQYPRLAQLGWNDELATQFEEHALAGLQPGRVAVQHRGAWEVATEEGDATVEITGRLRHAAEPGELPVVGDWVGLRENQIDLVLPRRSKFSRKTPFTEVSEQVLVANVDVAFLVMGLDERDFSVRRLERYLTTAWEGGATPVIVLNKADLAEDLEGQLAQTEAVAFGVPVHVVTALAGEGIDVLLPYLAGAKTGVLLGSSGVGKSTLINALLGESRLATGELREDGRGRHTTSHRELLLLPGGGVLIDTPGLRELQLWETEEGLDKAFADVAELVTQCRFSDCAHDTEPGCAIREALADGSLPAERWQSYLKLERELAHLERKFDPRLRSEERKKWAAMSKAYKKRKKILGR
ncbi:MAG: ribosome small subunit-dependent GTPase A [Actinomycetota bacterium]|nr:ribosome small subunit-dependent GTPase A [Actinomycetota bacterium]